MLSEWELEKDEMFDGCKRRHENVIIGVRM